MKKVVLEVRSTDLIDLKEYLEELDMTDNELYDQVLIAIETM